MVIIVIRIVCLRGFDELLKTILKHKFTQNSDQLKKSLNSLNDEDFSPLHEASSYGYTTICEYLIDYGADIGITNNLHNTHIHYAIVNGHQDTVELLIEKDCDLQIMNKDQQTPYKLMFKYAKNAIDKLLDKKQTIIARVSSIYKNNVSVIEFRDFTINRDLQVVFCRNEKTVFENQRYETKQKNKLRKQTKLRNKIIPIQN